MSSDPLTGMPAAKIDEVRDFASEAEAAAAHLPKGTKVRVNGRRGTVQ